MSFTAPTQLPALSRDLKLDNILIDSQNPPAVKLCDFGFSKAWPTESDFEGSPSGNRLKSMRVGTADYMPPELIKSK